MASPVVGRLKLNVDAAACVNLGSIDFGSDSRLGYSLDPYVAKCLAARQGLLFPIETVDFM